MDHTRIISILTITAISLLTWSCGTTPNPDPVEAQVEAISNRKFDFESMDIGIQAVLSRSLTGEMFEIKSSETTMPFTLMKDSTVSDQPFYFLYSNARDARDSIFVFGMRFGEHLCKSGKTIRFDKADSKEYQFYIASKSFTAESPPPLPFYFRFDKWDTLQRIVHGRASGLLLDHLSKDTFWLKECYFKALLQPL